MREPLLDEDENGPKARQHDLGSEDGEMADVLQVALKHEVIFNHGKNQWHIRNSDNGLWLPDKVRDVQNRVDEVALDFVTEAARDRSDDGMKRVKVYRRLREQSRIESSLRALASREPYKTDGSKFDRNANLLGVRNGVLDLETLTLTRPGDPNWVEQHVSQSAAVEWPDDPTAEALKAGKFVDFLQDILGGDDDLTLYMMRLLGYCLLGTTQEEKFWLAVGPGRNGKGTLLKFMHWLLGDYATFLQSSLYIRNRWGDVGADRAQPELGNLWGRRFAVTSEPVKGEFNEQMLKAHTGRDPITFRRMRSDILWTFDPTHKLFFLTQEAPSVDDVGPSMRARARVIQFEQSYVGREVKDLQDQLKAIGSGILVMLALQAQAYLSEGLPENDKVLAWSDQYLRDSDPLGQFLADCCDQGKGFSSAGQPLYDAYRTWSASHGDDPKTQSGFGIALSKRFDKTRTNQGVVYAGLRVKNLDDTAAEEPDAA